MTGTHWVKSPVPEVLAVPVRTTPREAGSGPLTTTMIKTLTHWLLGLIGLATLLFVIGGFAAIFVWFDRAIADPMARYSGYTILGLGVLLIIFLLYDARYEA